jgi:hypothetical protein
MARKLKTQLQGDADQSLDAAALSPDPSSLKTIDEVPAMEAPNDAVPSGTSDAHTATLLGNDVPLSDLFPGLVCPTEWVEEALTHPCLESAKSFIQRLSPPGLVTPWLITSMSKDLSGADRNDSKSHLSGQAMDIAPMYQDNVILPEDPTMLGLAWNAKALILIGETQWGDLPIFVEGDHVHIATDILPAGKGLLPVMWSDSDAYQSVRVASLDPVLNRLRNSFWMWDTVSLELHGPSEDTYRKCMSLIVSREEA